MLSKRFTSGFGRKARRDPDAHALRERLVMARHRAQNTSPGRGDALRLLRHKDRNALRRMRGMFGVIKRELRRRSAITPVIGHLKAESHLACCYLKGRAGDAANAILFAVGYSFRRILAWLKNLLRLFLIAIGGLLTSRSTFAI